MEPTNSIKHWELLIIRGLLLVATGIYMALMDTALKPGAIQVVGGLFIAAGAFGGVYGLYNFRVNRNFFWELLRSVFDMAFGITFLLYASKPASQFVEALSFWAILYSMIHAVQTIYIAMLSGGNQPRNLRGTLLHWVSVLTGAALAYVLLNPDPEEVFWPLAGLLLGLFGLLSLLLAIQQRRSYLINRAA